MESKYIHHKISSPRSIRVLTLFPSCNHEAPLCGSFSEYDLDASTSTNFEALSYVWGTIENPGVVTIVRPDCPQTEIRATQLTVTLNCASALRRLRHCNEPRRLWVDAICIDQESVLEKNEQVALMVEIYGKAKQVLMWLQVNNEEEDRTRDVSRLIKLVGQLYRRDWLHMYYVDDTNQPESAMDTFIIQSCTKYVELKSLELLRAIRTLFMNRYFRRVWTVQEIAMAHQVQIHYGTAQFAWADFVTYVNFFVFKQILFIGAEHSDSLSGFYETYVKMIHGLETHFVALHGVAVEAFHNRRKECNTFEQLRDLDLASLPLFQSKGLEATEARDQAYAMLWAFSSPNSLDLQDQFRNVDYTKPLATIYTEYTIAFMRKDGNAINLLPLVNSTPRNPSLPSWVPDWNETTPRAYHRWTLHLYYFQSSNTSRLSSNYGVFEIMRRKSLRFWGIDHSKVKVVISGNRDDHPDLQDPVSRISSRAQVLLRISRIMRDLINTSQTLVSMDGEKLMKALHRAFNVDSDGKSIYASPTELEAIDCSIFSLLIPLIDHTLEPVGSQQVKESLGQLFPSETIDAVFRAAERQQDFPPFLAVLIELLSDRAKDMLVNIEHYGVNDFFFTDSGNIGMAYRGVQDGDLVTIWRGCPCPMIVRRKEDAGPRAYHFHGPAYVDGIMNGEAWPDIEEGLQEFILV